jgi:manganese transport protein
VNLFLYGLAEIAIAACDLAEVVGMAIGLQLLFNIPLIAGVCITVLDTFLLLFLLNFGIRKLEAFIIFLVSIIGMSFVAELFFAQPSLTGIAAGIIPHIENSDALKIAIGIIGATVMPHNLYLHSSLVQTRKFERTEKEIKKAIRYNVIDSAVALNAALFVNAAILILAAASFHANGYTQVEDIKEAHKLLMPLLGTVLAPILFAVALLASGQSSTITGTLAGQIIMEGYLSLRIQPWLRRIITRVLAIGPALIILIVYGENKTVDLLVFSQIVLSLQLGFAIVPLIHFVSSKEKMGVHKIGLLSKILSWISALTIIGLNVSYLFEIFSSALQDPDWKYWMIFLVIPISLFSFGVLLYIVFQPFFSAKVKHEKIIHHSNLGDIHLQEVNAPKVLAVSVDFSASDNKAISKALFLGGKNAHYVLIHVVETPNAFLYGKDTKDHESGEDEKQLNVYRDNLIALGYSCSSVLGFGIPKKEIARIVIEQKSEMLVMGTHGHKTMMDLIFGTTVEGVRHRINCPMVIV